MASNSQDRIVQERALQTPKRGHVTLSRTLLSASISKGDGDNLPSSMGSKKFSWLSPASTVSTVSTSAGFGDIWDSPETPSGKSSAASSRSILMPLTPLTPPESSKKLYITPLSKLSFGVEVDSLTKQHTSEKKDVALQDDLFQPRKLFRNLTLELEAIAQKNIAANPVKYDINPSFVFTNDPVSSRTRSKTGIKAPVTSVVHAAVNEGISSGKATLYRSPPPIKGTFGILLEQIIPHDIHARLVSEPDYCVASLVTRPSVRCTKTKGSFRDIGSILKKLARCESQENYCGMLLHLEELVNSVMCGTHQNTVLRQLKAGSRMAQLRSRIEDMTGMTERDRLTLTRWVNAICDLDGPTNPAPELHTIAPLSKPVVQLKSIAKPKIRASAVQTTVRFTFLPSGFQRYEPSKTENLSVFSALYQEAASPLTPRAFDPGFIYLYWDKEYFGKVKIGYTNNLARRLREWNDQCRSDNAFHSSAECQVEMPHVYRVEQLIHTELKEYRLRRKCDGCGKMHKEWFEANEVHVIKVLKKWREWILQEPYVQDEDSGEWVLRPEMLDSLERVCEPVPQEMSTRKPTRRSGSSQRAAPTKKGARRTM